MPRPSSLAPIKPAYVQIQLENDQLKQRQRQRERERERERDFCPTNSSIASELLNIRQIVFNLGPSLYSFFSLTGIPKFQE